MSHSALAVGLLETESWFSRRIRRRLCAYRAALAEGWSESTVHPEFIRGPDSPRSAGQCGVSSAWLLHKLPWLLRTRSRYCVGDILVGDETLQFHCWIEVGNPTCAERWVIDLTCDQFELLSDRAFVCERHSQLTDLAIQYNACTRLSGRQLRDDPVWHRAQLLAKSMTKWLATDARPAEL